MRNSPEISNFTRLFLKLNRFICNRPPVLPEQLAGALGFSLSILLVSPNLGICGPLLMPITHTRSTGRFHSIPFLPTTTCLPMMPSVPHNKRFASKPHNSAPYQSLSTNSTGNGFITEHRNCIVYKRTSHSSDMKAPKHYATQRSLFVVSLISKLVLKISNDSTRGHLR